MQPFASLPTPCSSGRQLAVFADDSGLVLAVGCGPHLALLSSPSATLLQLLGPHASHVRCIGASAPHSLLAAGVGEGGVLYSRGAPMVWTAGQSVKLWMIGSEGSVVVWSCALSQPVHLIAASADAKFLATAAAHDRLLKVWYRAPRPSPEGGEGMEQGFSFCYLRHPRAVRDFQWRPAAWRAAPIGWEGRGEGERSILLSCCVDGTARLWSVGEAGESTTLTLCATLGLEDVCSRGLPAVAGEERRFQLVQWVQPTCRPSVGEERSEGIESLLAAPGSPLSPPSLLRSSSASALIGGPPTLRPSLQDRHDYILASLADGSVVVWLLLGLSSAPRSCPKVVIFANLPRALPAVRSVLGSSAFCHFAPSTSHAPCSDVGTDQLPSAVSMVQHVDDSSSSLRLTSLPVDRAANERSVRTLHGHTPLGAVLQLLPHPSLPLVASISSDGELMLWECDLSPSPSHTACSPWHGREEGHEEFEEARCEMRRGGARWLLRVPWEHRSAAWLVDEPTLLVEREGQGDLEGGERQLVALLRTCDALHCTNWHASSGLPLRWEAGGSSSPSLHLAALPLLAPPCEALSKHSVGFALSAANELGVWAHSRAQPLVWLGRGSLALGSDPSSSPVCCAAAPLAAPPAPSPFPSSDQQPQLGSHASLLAAYSDGRVCVWTLSLTSSGELHLTPACSVAPQMQPEGSLFSVSSLCASARGPSPRAALLTLHPSPTSHPLSRLCVLEFESLLGTPREEFHLNLQGPPPACSLTTLACGGLMLAVSSRSEIQLFTRSRSSMLAVANAAWELRGVLPLPTAHISAVAWLYGGSLLSASGPQMFLWPTLPSSLPPDCRGPLPQWHPAVLKQHLICGEACAAVLGHLSKQSRLSEAPPLGLEELMGAPVNAPQPTPPASELEDLFAPSLSPADLDFFAPSQPEELAVQLSAQPARSAPSSPHRQLLLRLRASECPPGLDQAEQQDLISLLETLETLDSASSALDECGKRFLLLALQGKAGGADCVSHVAVAWALLSACHTTLLDICLSSRGQPKTWPVLRSLGVGFWFPQGDELKALFEQVAKLQFSERRNPEDCALLYLSLGKKKQLQALCKAVRNERLHAFLSNDFSEPRWRSAAMKNAYALLSKQQYELCAAFFVLGGEVDSAVRVCARQLNDVQLALLLCRLHADGWPSLLQSTVQEEVAPAAAASADRWLACVGHLLLGEAQQAIDALAHHLPPQPTQPSPQPTDLPPRASGLPSNAAAMGGVLLADACVPALCDAVHSQPKWRLRPSPLPSQLLLRCAHAWRMAGMPLCAMTNLQRAGGEAGEVVLLDACSALLLSRSQEHLGSPPASPSQCALALTSTTRALREDLQVLQSRFAIRDVSLASHLSHQSYAADSSSATACIALLLTLELWQPIATLTATVATSILATLTPISPHDLTPPQCAHLLQACATLCATRSLLPPPSQQAEEDLTAWLALYAVGSSLKRLDVLAAMIASDSPRVEHACWAALLEAAESSQQEHSQPDAPLSATLSSPPLSNAPSSDVPSSLAREYCWCRIHLLALNRARRLVPPPPPSHTPHLSHAARPPPNTPPHPLLPPPSQVRRASSAELCTDSLRTASSLISAWLLRARVASRELAARLPREAFPVEMEKAGLSHRGASRLWRQLSWRGEDEESSSAPKGRRQGEDGEGLSAFSGREEDDRGERFSDLSGRAEGAKVEGSSALSGRREGSSALSGRCEGERGQGSPAPTERVEGSPPPSASENGGISLEVAIWPLDGECPGVTEPSASPVEKHSLHASPPLELLHRKGDFVRCVCVNPLNHRQLAVSLSRGVHQLEITGGSPELRFNNSFQQLGDSSAWERDKRGAELVQKTYVHGQSSSQSPPEELCVHLSLGTDTTARCLCSHPTLPLYLAGGDSVVQCWQFGQTIQGRGLQDHLRTQYKLPSGDRVASMRVSPCGEQFASIDANGFLCLWRFAGFQSGLDMPLPFTRLHCHSRRGADLCYIGSSVLLASVGHTSGASSSGTPSLGLWDVLLPPARAQVASCNAHADGGCCIAYSPETNSIITGGERGDVSIFDLRQRRQRQHWTAHPLAIKSLAVHEQASLCFSASADGDVKLWDFDGPEQSEMPCGHWTHAHEPHTMFHPLSGTTLGRTYGINQIVLDSPDRLLTAGADGKVKLWALYPALS